MPLTIRALIVVLALAPLLSPGLAADFMFKHEADVSKIFQIIATLGRFNVVVSPDIRARMPLEMSGVDPEEAVDYVARVCHLKATRYAIPGAPVTYLITQPGKPVPQTIPGDPSATGPIDLVVKMEVPLFFLASMAGRLGDFNVVVGPVATPRGMAIAVSRLPAESVVHLLAAANGLVVEAVRSASGSRTFLLKPPQPQAPAR